MRNILAKFNRTLWDRITGRIKIVYLDTQEFFLDREFDNYKIIKQFGNKADQRYVLRVISIKYKALEEFYDASFTICNRAMVCGYPNFKEVYDHTFKMINA